MTKKEGFQTVETNFEELDEKIRIHRKKIFWRVIGVSLGVIVTIFLAQLWMAVRGYDSYEIRNSVDRNGSEAAKYEKFLGNIIEYSNDGIGYMTSDNELLWNQSFEMVSPKIDICKDYLVIYDRGGTLIYIMQKSGVVKQIETAKPIQTVCIASQGTIAVLMKEDQTSYLKVYDKTGGELANGEFYGEKGGFPIDLAFSYDGKKLAVGMIDVNDGDVKSTITFYNLDSVGQNEINNNVGTFSYSDMLIPEIEYISEDTMIAIGDSEIIIFQGKEKPKMQKEIFVQKELTSVFYNEKYIGIAYSNESIESGYHIEVYNLNGGKVMENDTAIMYDAICFLDNNEICVKNQYECELFTIHSIKKFSYRFDTKLMDILSNGNGQDYIFLFDEAIEEVHLK
ncbi:MAG: hypothetical protein II250_04180 [Agathobacter sp.]|nr:hypothetical protein [Agathobacter sp.]